MTLHVCNIVFFALHAEDASIGRIDKTSCTQQTLMELVIDKITNKEVVHPSKNHQEDITKWTIGYQGLSFTQDGFVRDLRFAAMALKGGLQLEWLPESTKHCDFARNSLSGSVTLDQLPDALKYLSLNDNQFEGTMVLTHLPVHMETLLLRQNRFSGTINLQALPKKLKGLNIARNTDLVGMTDFSELPDSLKQLNIVGTSLEGELVQGKGKSFRVDETSVHMIFDASK